MDRIDNPCWYGFHRFRVFHGQGAVNPSPNGGLKT